MIPRLLLCITIVLLVACDSGLKTSDYRGGYITESGDCPESGDLGMYYRDLEIEMGFYCFLKECALVKGQSSPGGFFHIETDGAYFVKGKIGPEQAKGTWYLNMNGKDCSGHWVALKNR